MNPSLMISPIPFLFEIERIRKKYLKAGYPYRFINSVIDDFQKKKEEEHIIPPWLFEEKSFIVSINIPYCLKNENEIGKMLERLNAFTNFKYRFRVLWKTHKVKSLFPIKDKICHISNVVYEGTCDCTEIYIGETSRNAEIRWSEHTSSKGKSEVSKHILMNEGHEITWKILTKAPVDKRKRKILEAFYIKKFSPSINDQLDIKSLKLFRNGIT